MGSKMINLFGIVEGEISECSRICTQQLVDSYISFWSYVLCISLCFSYIEHFSEFAVCSNYPNIHLLSVCLIYARVPISKIKMEKFVLLAASFSK